MNLCRRVFMIGIAVFVLASGAQAAIAQALRVQGTELTPQFITKNGAIFVYQLRYRGWRVGGGIVQVDHAEQLPTEATPSVPVIGGTFGMWVGWFAIVGEVTSGEITTTDNPDIYNVTLLLLSDENVPLTFVGELDHRPLLRRPPRLPKVSGELLLSP
jgi:hypothetical protein